MKYLRVMAYHGGSKNNYSIELQQITFHQHKRYSVGRMGRMKIYTHMTARNLNKLSLRKTNVDQGIKSV